MVGGIVVLLLRFLLLVGSLLSFVGEGLRGFAIVVALAPPAARVVLIVLALVGVAMLVNSVQQTHIREQRRADCRKHCDWAFDNHKDSYLWRSCLHAC